MDKCKLLLQENGIRASSHRIKIEDGWIGFNAEKDFLRTIPSFGSIGSNSIFMPGTAYNLNFAIKRS